MQNVTKADLILFAGQSNMAGRGATNEQWPERAPEILSGAGYEFRAVSDPTCLYRMAEPFGRNENREGGIHDGEKKTGSMVTAFTNAYYLAQQARAADPADPLEEVLPVIGISASKGGSCTDWWLPDSSERYMEDCLARCGDCEAFLEREQISVRRRFVLWCQGESDADIGNSEETYKAHFRTILQAFQTAGFEKLLLVQIGQRNTEPGDRFYEEMMRWQEELAEELPEAVLVSRDFAGMRDRGLMKDKYHYYQAAYNECGRTAGKNAAWEI